MKNHDSKRCPRNVAIFERYVKLIEYKSRKNRYKFVDFTSTKREYTSVSRCYHNKFWQTSQVTLLSKIEKIMETFVQKGEMSSSMKVSSNSSLERVVSFVTNQSNFSFCVLCFTCSSLSICVIKTRQDLHGFYVY